MGRPILVSLTDCAVPPGGTARILCAPDNVEIRTARWPAPDGQAAKGTVVVFNGRTEFVEKYYETIRDLQARGYAVVTLDWRGQGLSGRMLTNRHKGFVGSFDDFVADAKLVLDTLDETNAPHPRILLAHSMGGNIALRVLQEDPERFERAVLCAPMTGIHADFPPIGVVKFLSMCADALGLGPAYAPGQGNADPDAEPFEQNAVTTDRARYEQAVAFVRSEPDLALGGVTWHWLREAFASIRLVTDPERVRSLRRPLLICSAGDEKFVDPASHKRLAAMSPLISLVQFPDARHEILQECDTIRDRFWDAFDAFTDGADESEKYRLP